MARNNKLWKYLLTFLAGFSAVFFYACSEDQDLAPVGSVEGYIYYAGTTIPVPGVTVSVASISSATNTHGNYKLSGIPQGNYTLNATKEGFDQYSANIDVVGQTQHVAEMHSLTFTGSVSGHVSNQFNELIAGIEVVILNPDGSPSSLSTISGEEGNYTIHFVPLGERTFSYRSDKHQQHQSEFLLSDALTELDVSLFEWGRSCADQESIFYEGQEYKTVMIGSQCWLRENLNIGVMIESCDDMTNTGAIEKYCYDDDPANCEKYGGLYQWDAAMRYRTIPGSRGICPPGFHIPTDQEWQALRDFLGDDPANKLKTTTQWETPHSAATDKSGFSALPGGYRGGACALFYVGGAEGRWWTSTEHSLNGAWRRSIYSDNTSMPPNPNFKYYGLSVRCVRSID